MGQRPGTRHGERDAPDYARLPERIRIEDTMESQAVTAPNLPSDDLLGLTLSRPTDRT